MRVKRFIVSADIGDSMRDLRLVDCTRTRIDNCDYEALFTGGGCFHFALRLWVRFGHKIRGIRNSQDGKSLSHVWCEKKATSKAIDIHGVYNEEIIVKLAGGTSTEATYVPVDEVEAIIRVKDYPLELGKEIFDLADWIVDTHERLKAAKPFDERLYSAFVNDLPENTLQQSGPSGSETSAAAKCSNQAIE
jgi:hypothetical protein